MNQLTELLLCGLTAALTLTGAAQTVPQMINYQGRLTDAGGNPLPDSDQVLEFRIFDAVADGSLIWGPQIFDGQSSRGHTNRVPVVVGHFNVMLGPVDTEGDSLISAFDGGDRWIEIKVGANVISPRQRILSAPFAVRAEFAKSANSAVNSSMLAGKDWSTLFGVNDPSGKIDGAKLANITSTSIAPQSIDITRLAKAVADALVPVGTIVAFAGTNVPAGWLPCINSRFKTNQYPKLFAAIGWSWGAVQDPSEFRIPELSGMFLRGWSYGLPPGASYDPEAGKRVTLAYPGTLGPGGAVGGSIVGDRVGSYQDDLFKQHNHIEEDPSFNLLLTDDGQGTSNGQAIDSNTRGSGEPNLLKSKGIHSRGGAETRPRNVSVNYIIKHD